MSLSLVRELKWGEARIEPEDLDDLEKKHGPNAFDLMAKQGTCAHDRAGSHTFLRDPPMREWHDERCVTATPAPAVLGVPLQLHPIAKSAHAASLMCVHRR